MVVKNYLTKYLCFFYHINDSTYLILRKECWTGIGKILKVWFVGRRIMTFNVVLLVDDKKLATEIACFTYKGSVKGSYHDCGLRMEKE